MGTGIIIDGVVSQALSQKVTFELSFEQEETRPGLTLWFAMCMPQVVPGTDDKLK